MRINKLIVTYFFMNFFIMNHAMNKDDFCPFGIWACPVDSFKLCGFVEDNIKEKASLYILADYAQDSEIQKLFALQNSLKQEHEHYKKVKRGEVPDETLDEAYRVLSLRERTIQDVLNKNLLFGATKPTPMLLVFSLPQELLAWIEHHRRPPSLVALSSEKIDKNKENN